MHWMIDNHYDIMCKTDEIYGFCDNEWWSDFENQLGSLDAIQYSREVAFENQPDLTSDHCDRMWEEAEAEVENQLNDLYLDLRDCFHEWILQLNHPLKLQKINLTIQNSIFINFNYTKTLENLYGINKDNILHIHGCIYEDENFILGHGRNDEDLAKLYENHANDKPKLYEQLAEDAAISCVASQRKPVNELIRKYEGFFNALFDVSDIHVYGMSLSEIDMPYLNHILSIVKSANWEFSDFDGKNEEKIKNFCNKNNILKYEIIELNNLLKYRQLEIPFP